MIDKTTQGYEAEQDEVEALLHNLCGYHLAEPDPLFRYQVLTREQVLYDALVAAIKRERGRALSDLAASGQTLTQIAQATNLGTRQRVQRMISMAKAAEEAALALQEASRQFHERLAAVEATLDEVVSGIAPPPPAPVEVDVEVDEAPLHAQLAAELGVTINREPSFALEPDFGISLDPEPPVAAEPVVTTAADQVAVDAEPVITFAVEVPAQRTGLDDLLDSDPTLDAYDLAPIDGDLGAEFRLDAHDFDPDRTAPDDPDALFEPTRSMPALRGLLHPTKEMPPKSENAPWWRRNRDSGAA
jgi:hypothetical protein